MKIHFVLITVTNLNVKGSVASSWIIMAPLIIICPRDLKTRILLLRIFYGIMIGFVNSFIQQVEAFLADARNNRELGLALSC